MVRWIKAASLTLVATAAVAGCTAPDGENQTQTELPTLKLGVRTAPPSFEAAAATHGHASPFYQAVYDTLLQAKPDGTVVAGLASDWSYDAEQTTLTLTLQDGVTFTDGTPFDAEAAKLNLERFQAEGTEKQLLASVQDVTTDGDHTLLLRLSAPDPALLENLAANASYMQSPTTFGSADAATNPVGTGPYTLDSAASVIGSTYVFKRNPDYWDGDRLKYGEIHMNVYQDPTAVLNAIRSGQINAATTTTTDGLDEVQAAGWSVHLHDLDIAGIFILDRGGTLNPALADVRVRQAINHAFNKEALVAAVAQGYGTVTTQIFPPSSAGYDSSLDSRYDYDPDKARALLQQAGYTGGVELTLPSTPAASALLAFVEQQLEEAGFNVTVVDVGTNFVPDILGAKYGVTYFQLAQLSDWRMVQTALIPQATWNPFRYQDESVVRLAGTIQAGGAAAEAAVEELNAYIVEQAWFAPWYRKQQAFLTDADTNVELQQGNAVPYLWSLSPKA